MDNETIRLFIAIELPAELVIRLRSFLSSLKSSRLPFVKWVDPGSIHLTLKFLGNINAERLDAIKSALESVAVPHGQFQLATGHTGFFPGPQRARVFWLGLEGDTAELVRLQQAIDRAMTVLGFESESRPFTAHLTLARLREDSTREQRLEFTGLTQNAVFEHGPVIQVRSVSLMRSRLTPQGAVYTRLAEYELKGG
jgi:2'-5' RNA ligase